MSPATFNYPSKERVSSLNGTLRGININGEKLP